MTTCRFGARQGVGLKPNKPDIKNSNKVKIEATIKEREGETQWERERGRDRVHGKPHV